MRYIFVSGGVASSLGKGLTAACIGALLEACGLRVTLKKFDPYLNVDPGTMSPFQHGEVYVLPDGTETDLDLGHYERFTNAKLTSESSISSGKIYETIIRRERRGDYLGETVQVIPHVTDEIKLRMTVTDGEADVTIIELGGTVGDIESMPYLEAIRQFILDVGKQNVLYAHVALLPYLRVAGEIKTKPAQQSIALLRGTGIQPDLLFCRTEKPIGLEIRKKLSLFCNVPAEGVIQELDVQSIYEVPTMLHGEGVDRFILKYFSIETERCDLRAWEEIRERFRQPRREITIALVGKYVDLKDAYKSVYESLVHGGIANDCGVEIVRIDAGDLEKNGTGALEGLDGILVPGGFGDRGIEGKIAAARHAREHAVPYYGLCLGMQIAVIEFARNVCALADANSTEFAPATPHPVIDIMEEQKGITGKGGTMRLGAYECHLQPGTHAFAAYGAESIRERHRHRFEFNGKYRGQFTAAGLRIGGVNPKTGLVEIIEVATHPWFVGVQYHPEFKSKPTKPHPLFAAFIKAALATARARHNSKMPAST
jgi:CTP synthase